MTSGRPDDLIEDEAPSDNGLDIGFLREAGNGAPAAPAAHGAFEEDEQPDSRVRDDQVVGLKERHMSETRRTLAVGLLWLVGLLTGLPTLALVLGHWTHFKSDDYREISLVITPIVALASAAFGFFFASDERTRF
ncbi:hypothetical protein [Streptomyces griseocarneus]|uniref:hypothetical protein n=1 Tax=Streptomyces griseocarneus TaxID=51201 RepID=UPI00167D0937|nr:hypothetical protein [Streptomyces griseocarneus]MBZ6473925.1 hypothetical protein [Streptomyces griseocarneus]GHG65939.1 hypothetical protein GCM10018779_36990 [Streptomyces griseocarneus]